MTTYNTTKIPDLTLKQVDELTGSEDVQIVQSGVNFRTKSANLINDVEANLDSTSDSKQLAASQGKELKDLSDWQNSADGLIFDYASNWTLTPSGNNVGVTIPACEILEIDSSTPVSVSGSSGTVLENGGIVITKSGATYVYSFVDDLTTITEGEDKTKYVIVKNVAGNLYSRIQSITDYLDQTSNILFPYPPLNVYSDVSPALPYKSYLIDASSGIITISLPDVVTDNVDSFYIQLQTDGNHAKITTVGGTQLICGVVEVEIATTNTGILLKANGVDGYDIIDDGREYYRTIDIITSTDLSNGYESKGVYNCNPPGTSEITITIPDACSEHIGMYAKFILNSNSTGSVKIVTQSGEFIGSTTEPTIVTPSKGFEVLDNGTEYQIIQDSRPSVQQSSLTLYGLTESSTIPTYNRASTTTTDPDYSATPTDFNTGSITGTQLIGVFASDEGVIQGVIPETNIVSLSNWRKVSGSASAFAYADVYQRTTGGTETLIATTSNTPIITSASYTQFSVSALLPEQSFLPTDRVVIKVYMTVSGGGSAPTYELQLEGSNPARLSINVPSSTISHDSISGVNDAGLGVLKGHVNNTTQSFYGDKTFINNTAFSDGIYLNNATEDVIESDNGGELLKYDSVSGAYSIAESAISIDTGKVSVKESLSADIVLDTITPTLRNDEIFLGSIISSTKYGIAMLQDFTPSLLHYISVYNNDIRYDILQLLQTYIKVNGKINIDTVDTGSFTQNVLTIDAGKYVEQVSLYSQNSIASSATPSPVGSSKNNEFFVTALATNPTFAAPSGSNVNGNKLVVRIKDNGTSRTLAWNSIYRAVGIDLPTSTNVSETLYLTFAYNSSDVKWDLISVSQSGGSSTTIISSELVTATGALSTVLPQGYSLVNLIINDTVGGQLIDIGYPTAGDQTVIASVSTNTGYKDMPLATGSSAGSKLNGIFASATADTTMYLDSDGIEDMTIHFRFEKVLDI